jgi:hypothetical protein
MPYITNISFRDFGDKGKIKIDAEIRHNNKVEYDVYDYLNHVAKFNLPYENIPTVVKRKETLNLILRIIGV